MAIRKWNIMIIAAIAVPLMITGLIFIAFSIWVAVQYLSLAPNIQFSANDSKSVRIENTEAWQQSLFDDKKFSGAVLVIKGGEVLISKCCGYADAAKTVELTPQTSMRLASVSKQFTAAAILVLAQQERVGLDDLVSRHLKDFPFDDVTVRNLLNMTSGIPDCYMELAKDHKDEIGDCLTISDVPRLIAKFPPERDDDVNEVHSYCNTSYVLLAAIVESASGSSFEDFMAKELFEPLGMRNTRVWNLVSEDKTFEGKAEAFLWSNAMVPGFLDGVAGDGSVFSSLDDFVIWDQFWRDNDLVSTELMKCAFEKPTLNDGSSSDYGFGWVLQRHGHWHNGAWLGARTYTYQDDDFFVVVLDNSSSWIVDSMGQKIRDALDY